MQTIWRKPLAPDPVPLDTPLISSQFFAAKMMSTDSSNSIFDLADFWSHRADETAFQWGLSGTEYATQLILIYTTEVNNGGHDQYFFNRGTTHLQDTVDTLQTIGCDLIAGLLHSLLPIGNHIAEGLQTTDEAHDTLEEADQQYWQSEIDLFDNLRSYLQRNEHDILRAERGLPTLAPSPPLP
jgi:hypothetical protein